MRVLHPHGRLDALNTNQDFIELRNGAQVIIYLRGNDVLRPTTEVCWRNLL